MNFMVFHIFTKLFDVPEPWDLEDVLVPRVAVWVSRQYLWTISAVSLDYLGSISGLSPQYLWTISALSLDQLVRWLIGVGPLAGRMAGQQIAYVYSVNHGAMGQLNKKTKTITVSGRAGLIQACCVHSCVRWMYSGTYDFKDFWKISMLYWFTMNSMLFFIFAGFSMYFHEFVNL